MSAPQIPNLNSLRRGRGGGGGLGGRRRGGPPGSSARKASKDERVQQTDNDANMSRLSAVELGYLDDPFSRALCPNGMGVRRQPIINRGTYVRSYAVDAVVDQFLKSTSGARRQIISLGAGTDTRPFRLFSQKCSKEDLVYHELDFAATTSTKIRYILAVPLLAKGLGLEKPGDATLSEGRDALHSPHYHIHPIDLRTLSSSISPTFIEGVDPSLPTLLISECCLVYLPSKEADDVLSYFTQTLFPQTTPLSIVLYEPINPQDAFGQVMASNLAARGIILETLDKYDNIEAERKRLLDFGFNGGQGAADIDFLWERWVSEGEKDRIARIEMLDELEEWKLLSQHYCVAWGWRESKGFESWTTLVSQ